MNKPISPADLVTPKVTTGPIVGSRKTYTVPDAAPDLRVPLREIMLDPSAKEPPVAVYDSSGIYTDDNTGIDVENGLKRARVAWVRERGGIEEYEGRPIKPVDNGNVTGKHLARNFPNTPKPMRGRRRCAGDAIRIRPQRHRHQGNDLRRRAREPRPQEDARQRAGDARRRRELRRRAASLRDAGIRARRDRARPRHHPLQHQPRRTRADDHRPQFPGEDQRQHRQLRRHLFGRGRSGENGVGDPLGRRHRDGPLHRAQHPQHARMDPAQLAGADRHRADLPGAGEVRRRSRQARPGSSTRTR